jgi:[acyl-carrier-protein] S-malonyltransferase
MAPAVDALRRAAAEVTVADPVITLLSDADGAAVTSGKEWLERIVAQVAAPVRWDLAMTTMTDLGVTALIELPPAGTLTGIARRALPGVVTLGIKTPDDLAAARELIAEHLAEPDGQGHGHTPEWQLIVAPASGTFRSPGSSGDLGAVVARGGERALASPGPVEIIEWLVEDGDPVSEGQPVVRVQPKDGAGAPSRPSRPPPARGSSRSATTSRATW